MSWDLFEAIAEQLAEWRPRVSMNVGGESTLHPRLPNMVRSLRDMDMYVTLDTNATRLSPALDLALLNSGTSELVVCLDGDTPESYELMRERASFDKTIQNLRDLLHIRFEMEAFATRIIIKNIQFWRRETKLTFPQAYKGLFTDYPPNEFRSTWADYWPGTHRYGLTVPYLAEPTTSEYSPCVNLWKHMAISWDGTVHLCCLDLNRTSRIGHAVKDGIRTVWNMPMLVEARAKHSRGEQADMMLCRNCNQIRRPPDDEEAGLRDAGEDRFTEWNHEIIDGST